MVATLLFNLSLLGKPRHPTPTRLLMPCSIGPMSPDIPPLVSLPDMSLKLRNPEPAPHPARGSLHWPEQSGGSDGGAVNG
jgi:hypothetical protein